MKLLTHQKTQIIAAANSYLNEHLGLSNIDLSRKANVNPSYLSLMLRGKLKTTVQNKDVEIADNYFLQLAETIGYPVKKSYWENVPTIQFMQIMNALIECKENGSTGMIIGKTGFGKTNVVDVFCRKNPLHTFRITVSSLYQLTDIINELAEITGTETSLLAAKSCKPSQKVRVDAVIQRLIDMKNSGGKPIIIFDEGENMEISVLKMLKALYDALKDHCSVVIIGTEQLLVKLLNLRKRNRDAIPQLYRRFKAGQVNISTEKDFTPFFEKFKVEKDLQKLLWDLCDNYGELHDFLEPALRECDAKGEKLTEDHFRLKYNMPKK